MPSVRHFIGLATAQFEPLRDFNAGICGWAGNYFNVLPVLSAGRLATAVLSLVARTAPPLNQHQKSNILWETCPDSDTTQCAILDVPRDYSNLTAGDTVSIYMRKYPAKVPEEQKLGTILTNPGGPGGSGTAWVAVGGEELSTIVEGKYDILGFDPRGVNLTGPWTACFNTEAKPLLSEYQLELQGVPYPHSTFASNRNLANKISAIHAGHSAACSKNGDHAMLESVGTAFVVQDMVKIVEALGEDGLNYWGYSYGTILGATFAAMRPELVKRMVLDGVSNAETYFNDIWQWGRDGMDETYKTFSGFISTCAEAGPEYCDFATSLNKPNIAQNAGDLRRRIDSIYARLAGQPMVVADSVFGPGIFTAANLQKLLLNVLYSPSMWPGAMQALASLEKGDAADAHTALYYPYIDINRQPYNNASEIYLQLHGFALTESLHPILCGDTASTNISANAYTDYFHELGKISPVGEQWAQIVGGCNRWAFQAKQRYTGPWTIAQGLKKTRFPILFVSLDADPVTPLSSAIKMSERFGNDSAALLVQQGFGHCSTEHPSLCTYKHIREYFVSGKIPPNNTRCTPEPGFIYPTSEGSRLIASVVDGHERKLLSALHRLRKARSKLLNQNAWNI